ncbi:MAG TPA: YidH family protein [Xenococcaceae cyanobacterium]
MSFNPRRPTNETTELARERNREAAERTLTSWIQNCLGLIGFGTGFESIFAALHQAFPNRNPALSLRMTHIIGLTAIGLGILLLVLMVIAYLAAIRTLEQEDYFSRPLNFSLLGILVGTIISYGLIALVAVFFILPWQ